MGEKTLLPPPPHSLFDTSEGPQSVVSPLPEPPAGIAGASVPAVEAAASTDVPPANSTITLTSTPAAIITEDAEPIYVNERRDTTEAPPLVFEPANEAAPPLGVEVMPAASVVPTDSPDPTAGAAITWRLENASVDAAAVRGSDETAPTTVGADPAGDATLPVAAASPAAAATPMATRASGLPVITALPATPRRAQTPSDQIARERGVTPIRIPTVSKRYNAAAPPVLVVARKQSRRFSIGASALAGVCVIATAGAIVWGLSPFSETEEVQAHVVASPTPEPAPVHEPAVAEAAVVEATSVAPVEPSPAAPSTCSVSVTANVSGAALVVNGVRRGVAPAVVQTPCNSSAAIELRHPRYERFRKVLAVNDDVELAVKLEREKTTLTLWSEPAGAVVSYNGIVLGKTPLVAEVARYEQATVWFRAPGHAADWRRIMPKEKRKTVSIKLKGLLLAPPS